MLIISQRAWDVADTAALTAYVEQTMAFLRTRQVEAIQEPVLLLPQGMAGAQPVEENQLLQSLGRLAAQERILLAGAAPVATGAGTQTIGFLLSDSGEPLLRVPKISPDLVTGIGPDATSALGVPADFKAAPTKLGQVGILPGEDILSPHFARSLTWAGAEIILNPVREVSDHLLEGRRNARVARAWENTSYVAVASAIGGTPRGPNCSCLVDWNGVSTNAEGDADILLPMWISSGSAGAAMPLWRCSRCICGPTCTRMVTSGSSPVVLRRSRSRRGDARLGLPRSPVVRPKTARQPQRIASINTM
jgi:predicted amidohydrolase